MHSSGRGIVCLVLTYGNGFMVLEKKGLVHDSGRHGMDIWFLEEWGWLHGPWRGNVCLILEERGWVYCSGRDEMGVWLCKR